MDYSPDGFRWMDFNDIDNSIVSYARFGKDPADHVVCLLNFTPNVIHDYKVGVPSLSPYREIFNSDQNNFGGSSVTNPDPKVVFNEPFAQAPYHILVSVPPLGGLLLKPVD
jgi:1,4-alpha-glucan branching enzyme